MLCSLRRSLPALFALPVLLALGGLGHADSAQAAQARVGLGTTNPFALLAGSTITNTGDSVINGDLGLHPGTAVTGFPPATLNGAAHVSDAVAKEAKADLVTAYKDAAGRSQFATSPPDIGNRTLKPGVYRTGSVPSLGLTGNLTLDAQGDPSAVFIFQVESALTTATDSSVSLINGAQACNVYWQLGSSATLGTRTAFKGTILALASISVNDAATVDGRLLARNGAVTLINDTITRSQCADGSGPGSGPGGGPGSGPGGGPGNGSPSPGPDLTGPVVRIVGPNRPGRRPILTRGPFGPGGPPVRGRCTERNFTARVRLKDGAGIRKLKVYLDGRLLKRVSRTRLSLRIQVRGLRVGSHQIKVVASDRAGNVSVMRRSFARCTLRLVAPRFTG